MARLRFAIVAVVGGLAAGSGLVVLVTSPARAASGWLAYAPLSSAVYVPPPSHQPLGLVLVAVGCAVLGAGVTGLVLLKRRP